MRYREHLLGSVLLLAAACTEPAAGPKLSSKAETEEFLMTCPLSIRPINADDSVQNFQVVGPEHVEAFHGDRAHVEGESAVYVVLNEDGNRRMLRYTKGHVGGEMAVFCGDEEMSRATIAEPFSSPFRALLVDERVDP